MVFKLGVVGQNISYSKSPFIHHEFGKALGFEIDYTIQNVTENRFEAKITELQQAGFTGCNITLPYKEAAFALADAVAERALQVAAANTFTFLKDDSIFADNTDGVGLARDVSQNIGFMLSGKRILMCGAGGAVRSVLGTLIAARPAEIIVANRNFKKAQDLAQIWQDSDVALVARTYPDLADHTFDVVFDGTSLKTENLPIPASVQLSRNALVYDLKYNPDAPTATMQWGKAKGAKEVHDGIGMLVEQAAESFHLWTDKVPQTRPVILKLKKLYQYS